MKRFTRSTSSLVVSQIPQAGPLGRSLIVLLFLCVALLPVAAQPTATVRGTPSEDPLVNRYQTLIKDSFEIALTRLGYQVTSSGDVELQVEVAMFPPRLHLSISVYDAASGALVAGVNGSGRTNVTLLTSLDELFAQIEPELTEYLQSFDNSSSPFVARPEIRRLRFRGADGTSIRVNNGPTLGVTEGLELEVTSFPVSEGSEVELSFERDGAYPQQQTIEIREGFDLIEVPELRYRDRMALQLHYTAGKLVGAGLGFRYYLWPDRLFAGTETDVFFSGVAPEAPNQVLHNEYRLLIGARVGPSTLPFRFDLSTGAGLLLSFPLIGTATPFLDPYVHIASVGIEARIRRVRPFVRGGATYALGGRFALLEEGVNPMLLSPSFLGGLRIVW